MSRRPIRPCRRGGGEGQKRDEGANARVWVANPQDKSVASRAIEVGATANGMVEVKKGLALGENVVTSGTLFIDRAAKRD